MQSDEYHNIKKDELSMLVNAERWLSSLEYKTKWEIEKNIAEARNAKYIDDQKLMAEEINELIDKLAQSEIVTKQKENAVILLQ